MRVPHPTSKEDEGELTKPNPQHGVMVGQINGLSNKEPTEKARQELRKPVLDKEKKIDFCPQ